MGLALFIGGIAGAIISLVKTIMDKEGEKAVIKNIAWSIVGLSILGYFVL